MMTRILLGACLLWSISCSRDVIGERIVPQAFSFPADISVIGGDNPRYAYVLSSNFDQRYTSGWISVVDLHCALFYGGAFLNNALLSATLTSQCGVRDTGDAETSLIRAIGQHVPLPSLGGQLAMAPDNSYLLSSFRGAPRLGVLPITDAGRTLQCVQSEGRTSDDCGHDRLMTLDVNAMNDDNGVTSDTANAITSPLITQAAITDPFSMTFVRMPAVGDTEAYWLAALTYLSSGWLSLFEIARVDTDGVEPTPVVPVLTHRRSVVLGTSAVGKVVMRPTSVADEDDPQSTPADDGRPYVIAVSKRLATADSANTVVYAADLGRILSGAAFSDLRAVRGTAIGPSSGGAESAGVVFSADGKRLYVANLTSGDNTSGVLAVLDNRIVVREETDASTHVTTLHPWPRLQPMHGSALFGRPMGVVQLDKPTGRYVLVAAFDDNAIDVFAERGDQLQWVYRIDQVSEGPFAMAKARVHGIDVVLITTFFDHSLIVLDVSGAAPSSFSILTRIRNANIPTTARPRF